MKGWGILLALSIHSGLIVYAIVYMQAMNRKIDVMARRIAACMWELRDQAGNPGSPYRAPWPPREYRP